MCHSCTNPRLHMSVRIPSVDVYLYLFLVWLETFSTPISLAIFNGSFNLLERRNCGLAKTETSLNSLQIPNNSVHKLQMMVGPGDSNKLLQSVFFGGFISICIIIYSSNNLSSSYHHDKLSVIHIHEQPPVLIGQSHRDKLSVIHIHEQPPCSNWSISSWQAIRHTYSWAATLF